MTEAKDKPRASDANHALCSHLAQAQEVTKWTLRDIVRDLDELRERKQTVRTELMNHRVQLVPVVYCLKARMFYVSSAVCITRTLGFYSCFENADGAMQHVSCPPDCTLDKFKIECVKSCCLSWAELKRLDMPARAAASNEK